MKKLLRILMWAVLVIIVLLVSTAVAIRVFLPPQKAKGLLEKELKSRLGREVKLGAVDVGLTQGIRVADFKISEKPTFDQGTFISSDHFSLRIIWPLLLAKKVVIQEISLDHPQVSITRYKDGNTYNFSDLTSKESSESSPSPDKTSGTSSASSFSVSVLKASLTKGRLVFVDQSPAQKSMSVDNLKLTTHGIQMDSPIQFAASCVVNTKGNAFNVDLNSRVSFGGDIHLEKAAVKSNRLQLEVVGDVKQFSSDNPVLNLKISIPQLDTTVISLFATLPADLTISGSMKGNVETAGAMNNLRLKPNFNFTSMAINQKGTFVKKENVPFTLLGDLTMTGENLDIASSHIVLASLEADLKGKVTHFKEDNRQLDLDVKSNQFLLSDVLALLPSASMPADVKLSGKTQIATHISGETSNLNYTIDVDGSDLAVAYADSFHKPTGTALILSARGNHTASATTADPFNLKLADANFKGAFKMASDGKTTNKTISLKSDGFPIEIVAGLSPASVAYQPTGIGELDMNVFLPEKGNMNYKGSLVLKNTAAKYAKSSFTKINSNIHFTPDAVEIPSLTGELDGGAIKLSANITGLTKKMVATLDVNAARVDLGKLMPPEDSKSAPKKTDAGNLFVNIAEAAPTEAPGLLDKPSNLSGHAVIGELSHALFNAQNVDLKWNLADFTKEMSRLGGTAALKTDSGILRKVKEKGKTSVFGKILSVAKGPSLDELKFKSITGSFTFKTGIMSVTTFNLLSPQISLAAVGTVGLTGTQPLGLKAPVTLGGGQASSMNTVHLKVAGSLTDPDVGLDMSETGKQAVDIIKSGAADKLLNAIGLPGFGRPTEPQKSEPNSNSSGGAGSDSSGGSSNSSSADNQQQRPEQQIESLLKGIFKKK